MFFIRVGGSTIRERDRRLLEATAMRILRWSGGLSVVEHRTNFVIRQFMKIKCQTDGPREARLRWYGHIGRREPSHILKTVL